MLFLYRFFPFEVVQIIKKHLNAIIIQSIFKLNRPLTNINIGDRVMILSNKKIYGTVMEIKNINTKIKLLPRIIPFWKKCNVNFWLSYNNILDNYNFPYYAPKNIWINNKKIIKLNSWKNDNINYIDNSYRISNITNNSCNNNLSKIFKYIY